MLKNRKSIEKITNTGFIIHAEEGKSYEKKDFTGAAGVYAGGWYVRVHRQKDGGFG